jgi:biotin carboxyl carrier protein
MKTYKFTISGNRYTVSIKSFEDNIAEIEVNGTPYTVEMEQEIKTTKTPKLIRPEKPAQKAPVEIQKGSGLSKITAPLPGTIFKIIVKECDDVKKGDTVLVMEAMKMENNILAEKEGNVKKILVQEGDSVLQGDLLIEIE